MDNKMILRKIDKLGRVVVPKKFRQSMDLAVMDMVDMHVDGRTIILSKQVPTCVFCGNKEELITYLERNVCSICRGAL
jgi:AbrB family transcriptional regulator, transcriptional pleiotropic regulator of transition state genes